MSMQKNTFTALQQQGSSEGHVEVEIERKTHGNEDPTFFPTYQPFNDPTSSNKLLNGLMTENQESVLEMYNPTDPYGPQYPTVNPLMWNAYGGNEAPSGSEPSASFLENYDMSANPMYTSLINANMFVAEQATSLGPQGHSGGGNIEESETYTIDSNLAYGEKFPQTLPSTSDPYIESFPADTLMPDIYRSNHNTH